MRVIHRDKEWVSKIRLDVCSSRAGRGGDWEVGIMKDIKEE